MTANNHNLKKVVIFLTLFAVISVTGCAGNYTEPAGMNTSETEEADARTGNAPDSSQPIENLSFYMNDSQRYESKASYNGQTEKYAIVQRFYVEDFVWVGNSGVPTMAVTYRDQGENVTQIFELQSSEIDVIYIQKHKVTEVITVRPAYTPMVTGYNIINYDNNGTNPYYRPYP